QTMLPRPMNLWDVFPCLLVHRFYVPWLFFFGFVFMVGDLIWRDRDEGGLTLVALWMRSRTLAATGMMVALGVLAVAFCTAGLVGGTLGAVLHGAPLGWSDSSAARAVMGQGQGFDWYPRI